MHIALIGNGALSAYVQRALSAAGMRVGAILVRPERMNAPAVSGIHWVSSVADYPADTDLVIDCAGHSALQAYGPDILRAGHDLVTVSLG